MQRTNRHESVPQQNRRTFLAGLGSLGLASFGITAGRASGTSGTDSDRPPASTDRFGDGKELEAFLDELMERRIGEVTPGATIAIVEGNTPVLTRGYGSADVDADVPVRADETSFRVGSVGKLVTWTAIMQCVERGVLDLDEDVNTYLQDSEVEVNDTYDDPVTLRHLGTHTPGFESALDPEVVADSDALAPLETVLATNQPSRVRPPGELVGYSNYGAALAGHIVATVNDTTFEEYVGSEIFEPLDMTHSTFAQPISADHPGTLAVGHTRSGGTFTTTDPLFINMRPAGSMSATANDMAAFISAHLGNGAIGTTRILNAVTARTMHERHHVRHPAVTNWRYGFHEHGDPDANLVGHSGATINFRSYLVLALDDDVGIFVSYNTNDIDDPDTEGPAAVIDELLAEYGLQPESTASPSSAPKSGWQDRAEAITGEYSASHLPQSGPLQLVDLLEHVSIEPVEPGRIATSALEGGTRNWIETAPYVYREADGHDVLAFETDGGDVTAMYMGSTPTGVYRPVPVHDRQLVAGTVLGGSVAGFGLSLGGWGAVGAWRRWTDRAGGTATETEGDR